MRIRSISLLVVLVFAMCWAASPARAVNDAAAEKAGSEAALKWLALIDVHQYEQSWNEIAPLLKQSINAQNWANAVGSVRNMVGTVVSRTQQSITYTTQVPGAPKGKYVIIIYDTKFSKRPAVETVTSMRCPDGTWRVSGYYLR